MVLELSEVGGVAPPLDCIVWGHWQIYLLVCPIDSLLGAINPREYLPLLPPIIDLQVIIITNIILTHPLPNLRPRIPHLKINLIPPEMHVAVCENTIDIFCDIAYDGVGQVEGWIELTVVGELAGDCDGLELRGTAPGSCVGWAVEFGD